MGYLLGNTGQSGNAGEICLQNRKVIGWGDGYRIWNSCCLVHAQVKVHML